MVEERENKLREEMIALCNSCDAQIVEKEKVVSKECSYVVDVLSKMDRNEILMKLLNNKIEATEGRAKVIEEKVRATEDCAKATIECNKATEIAKKKNKALASRAVEEYKDSDAFEANTIVVVGGVHIARFNDCKVKVVDAYLTLNLCLITTSGISTNEEEEDEEEGAEEATKGGEAARG